MASTLPNYTARILLPLLAILMLGCGKRGPLYLPPPAEPPAPAAVPDAPR